MPQYEHLDGHVEVTVAGSARDRELAAHHDPAPVVRDEPDHEPDHEPDENDPED